MSHEILWELLILLGASITFATIFHYLKQPTIVGFILAGVLIGPFGLGFVQSVPGARFITEIGIIFLLFTIGLEFSFRRILSLRRAFLGLGVFQVGVTIVVVGLICRLGFSSSWPSSIFMGCLVALSSTAIIMKMLQDSREVAAPYGTTTLAILLSQDIAVIPIMLALPLFAAAEGVSEPISWVAVGWWFFKFVGVVVFMVVGTRWAIPFLLEKVARTRSRELFFFSMLLLCFGVAFAMDELGMSLALGAFLAGMMIHDGPYGKHATADIIPLRDGFLGLFFASVGMLVNLRFFAEHFLVILLLVVVVFVVKVGIVYGIARLNRYPHATALITGLMVFQIGEFSFLVANEGIALGILSPEGSQYFLAVSVITMMLTPFIFRLSPKLVIARQIGEPSTESRKMLSRMVRNAFRKSKEGEKLKRAPAKKKREGQVGHTIIIGYGVAGANLASVMKALEIPYSLIDQNYDTYQRLKKEGEKIHYGDATRHEILEHAGILRAKLVVITVSGLEMTRAVASLVHHLRPDIKTIVRVQYVRECDELRRLEGVETVVAEYETAIELVARALPLYGVSYDGIEKCLIKTREELRGRTENLSDYVSKALDMPAWDAVGGIQPVRIEKDAPAVGKTLADLQLRASTGAIAVAVYRSELGTRIAHADFVLEQGDVVHLIGDELALERARELLTVESA